MIPVLYGFSVLKACIYIEGEFPKAVDMKFCLTSVLFIIKDPLSFFLPRLVCQHAAGQLLWWPH